MPSIELGLAWSASSRERTTRSGYGVSATLAKPAKLPFVRAGEVLVILKLMYRRGPHRESLLWGSERRCPP